MSLLIQHHVSLRQLNTFGVEANAARFVRVASVEDLLSLVASPVWNEGPRLILGGGSNILLTRDFDGLVVQIALKGRELAMQDDSAWYPRAAAGENWDECVSWTLDQGWPGLENLTLIPGTVGAAPIQNIGAYGLELKQRFHELAAIDLASGQVVRMSERDCRFGYRDSIFKNELRDRVIITSVTFRIPKVWRAVIDYGEVRTNLAGIVQPSARDIANVVRSVRRAKLPDPVVLGNAGSFFKNPVVSAQRHAELKERYPLLVGYLQPDGSSKLAAGWLIEQCGWKGRSMGRVGVHDRQALVLVNHGGASGTDVLALARAIQESVRQRFGVDLEPEPVIV